MPWGAVAGAVVGGVVNSALSEDKGGGAGASTTSKEPWLMAQPWITQNMQQGQALQNQYQAQPFNPQQQAAYANSAAQSDYMRSLVPSLLGQINQQQVGFDRNNPQARQKPWDWAGLMGAGAPNLNQQSVSQPKMPEAGAPAAQPASAPFTQQDMGYTQLQQQLVDSGRSPWLLGHTDSRPASNGGLGAYRYGDNPQPGTQAYRDMMEFFLMGGNDPYGTSAFGRKQAGAPGGFLGNSGNSVGGSAAADGSGGGGPGAF